MALAGPRLSVVLPNFNHARFLPGTIGALLSQSRPAGEIILIDDKSTDHSAELIANLAHTHASIRPVFMPENRGTVACMNYGLSLASGDYIYFCSADDHIYPNLFELAERKLQQHSQAALFSAEIRLIVPSGGQVGIRPIARPSQTCKFFTPNEVKDLLRVNDQFIATTTVVFRRDLLVANGGFHEGLESMADTVCVRDLALRHGFYFAPTILADYRIDSQGFSRSTTQNAHAALELISRGRVCIEANPLYPKGYAGLFERRMRFAVCRLALAEVSDPLSDILKIGAPSMLDRKVVAIFLGRVANWRRLMVLIWLTLRLRPYSIVQIIRTEVHRRFENRSLHLRNRRAHVSENRAGREG